MTCNHFPTPISLKPQQRRGLLNKPEKFSSYASSWPRHQSRKVRAGVEQGPRTTPAAMVSNLKAYVRLRAVEVGEVPRPAEFKGIVVLYKAEWLVHNDN